MSKQTITSLQKSKNNTKLVMVTAYDALFAKLLDNNVDMILVGDSLNMSFAGEEDTLSATLDQMIYHTKAVCAGAPNTFIVCDMPFGTYTDETIALKSAVEVYQKTKAAAVKIEGGASKAPVIKALTSNSIAVMGHIGLMPQFVRSEGGYKVKGKDEQNTLQLINDAKAVEAAGAFAIVVEGVKAEAAAQITAAVNIPVIGIGAGKDVDGQVLVWSDMFGFFEDFKPKFVRQYLNGAELIKNGLSEFNKNVKDGSFPCEAEMY
ncbi:MAG: 3-methyl-2-oxobutanoate hydroxymethyltransferase [Campylobacteraceae bacterium]|mgnify:FL=1|nr:3-methyl-2-oxobutanoate hydroxymethyltransferase [Campylobacteraceae bacterium]MBT3882904.1 3-methyl-2-oxobutanoate hydroxymethyltransferase [Campylobacteraceae bacterium]MBT4030248.1 3-methyl-2-oxobutanoate hydroxymethyltransferase [Campylobacteraceae bacterium]MBT4179904.1 3-methyl-2-oxobutanoate hydroxymethyltransferase [Campylobacteraceae bacterium]MBT4571831.1 3-methyl-2-oxobutanoate hydroxymethyltransferase [Campylobacteraceae bacterium]